MGDESGLNELCALVNGCRDDQSGMDAKRNIVEAYLTRTNADCFDTMCALHLMRSVKINGNALVHAAVWHKAEGRSGGNTADAGHPGLYLASTLAGFEAGDMKMVADKFFTTNTHVNIMDCLRFVNQRGFLQKVASVNEKVFGESVVNWAKPPRQGVNLAAWKSMWDESNPSDPVLPSGGAQYITVRNARGVKSHMCFLGGTDSEDNPDLPKPPEVLLQGGPAGTADAWRLKAPSMCVATDAGSMHPCLCDSINKMHNLPQFREWVSEQLENKAEEAGDQEPAETTAAKAVTAWAKARKVVKAPAFVKLKDVVNKTMEAWGEELQPMDPHLLGDGSLNTLIFSKLKDVFAATLDACKLAEAWVVVDRTDGQGSATAEILLELALERGAQKPTIVAIDSLERLGNAKPGSRSHDMFKQLRDLYNDEASTKSPNGTEPIKDFNFLMNLGDYDSPQKYAHVPDDKLPVPIVHEHKRISKDPAINGTCDPMRKWRYFYVDGLFASATHYIFKSNDNDKFDLETLPQCKAAFLYAHGDTRTFKRLRSNIQQGKSIVMLHNSGGVVTAFSWLQRVMAHMRPPPDAQKMRGPLRFLIANLSKANWVNDFGTPEIMMMRTLADRAPQLFRKNVVSVDILTQSEEEALEVITGCFSMSGGVPELGLGNAEVNVTFTTWKTHLMLYQNSKEHWRKSIIAQVCAWVLAIVITVIAVFQGNVDSGAVFKNWQELPAGPECSVTPCENLAQEISEHLRMATLVLPVGASLITAIMTKSLWRDKWSVCIMAASQLTAEIYKFRVNVSCYDPPPPPPSPDGKQTEVKSAKEKSRDARMLLVHRVSEFYGACLTEVSQGFALKRRNKRTKKDATHEKRLNTESKPTLAEWFKIKKHVERHYYKNKYVLPVTGGGFLTWMSGLKPYLQQQPFRVELTNVIEGLVFAKKVKLRPPPLSENDSKLIRYSIARKLGVPAKSFNGAKDEIRQIQRELVTNLWKEHLGDLEQEEKEEKEKQEQITPSSEVLADKEKDVEQGGGVLDEVMGASEAVSHRALASAPKVLPHGMEKDVPVEDEERFADGGAAMRKLLMEMQGLKTGNLNSKEKAEEKKKLKKRGMIAKQVDDDYLVGPLSTDSYVTFRVRPLTERLEKQAVKLSGRLQFLDILGFCISATGTILAAYGLNSWISVTVAVSSVVFSITEFTQLRNQVVSTNLALRDLHAILVKWDSLSLVKRRVRVVAEEIVMTTENAFLDVVKNHTTAASNTQVSVAKSLDGKGEEEEGDAPES